MIMLALVPGVITYRVPIPSYNFPVPRRIRQVGQQRIALDVAYLVVAVGGIPHEFLVVARFVSHGLDLRGGFGHQSLAPKRGAFAEFIVKIEKHELGGMLHGGQPRRRDASLTPGKKRRWQINATARECRQPRRPDGGG